MTDGPKLVHGAVDVSIISNGNEARLSAAQDAAKGFFQSSPKAVRVLRVVEWQGITYSPTRWGRVQRTLLIFGFELKTALFLATTPLALVKLLVRHCFEIARSLSGPEGKQAKRFFAEIALTDKHIRCLSHFVESGSHYLLVLEDDVILSEDATLTWGSLLSSLKSRQDSPVFVSLAKAFTLKELGLEGKVEKLNNYLFRLRKGATNTTAAYLVNRLFAEKALAQILSQPSLRRLPSDLMISALIRRINKVGCFHAQEGPFINGSLLGLTKSEIRP